MDFKKYRHKRSLIDLGIPYLLNNASKKERQEFPAKVRKFNIEQDKIIEERKKLRQLFILDACQELGLTAHPEAEKVFEIAFDIAEDVQGCSGLEYEYVFDILLKLTKLIKREEVKP